MNRRLEVRLPADLEALAGIDVAVILGSGLSGLANAVQNPRIVDFADIDGFPSVENPVVGHSGRLTVGDLAGHRVACFQGRIHCYQGFSAFDVAYPVRLSAALGASVLIVTNAAGGISEKYRAGDIVVLSDQVNMMGDSPLVGWPGPRGGSPFVPMRDAFDPDLRDRALAAAADADLLVHADGVYFGLLGPAYETPAEVEMLRRLGADLVGMSTVAEVIAARAMGLRVLGISLVANAAAGPGLSHGDVLDASRAAAERMERLIIGVLSRLSMP